MELLESDAGLAADAVAPGLDIVPAWQLVLDRW
jgi:hypothetical protein